MVFRHSKKQPVLVTGMAVEQVERRTDTESGEPGRGRWSTAFLMASSALLGATALAFWNRRTIVSLRAQIQAQPDQIGAGAPGDEEIL